MAVKVAIIGCGAIAQRRHIIETIANPDAQLVGLCDVNEARVKKVADLYETKAFTDHNALIEQTDADMIVVATPNVFHGPQTLDALKAGKHVLVEKPMAGTREEGRAMIAAAKKAKKFLMIGLNQRMMAPHVKAKSVLDTGRLGKVLTFQTTYKHPGPDAWSIDGAKSWFFKKPEAIMGVTGDLGVHKADLMRFLLGQEFTHVGGFIATIDKKDPRGKPISVDDNAVLTLKTNTGAIGTMTISWTNYGKFEDNGTSIYCENGVLSLSTNPQYGVIVNYLDGTAEYHTLAAVATNVKQVNSHVMDTFVKCILTNTPPTIDGLEGYKALDVILTAMEAAEQGKMLKIGAK